MAENKFAYVKTATLTGTAKAEPSGTATECVGKKEEYPAGKPEKTKWVELLTKETGGVTASVESSAGWAHIQGVKVVASVKGTGVSHSVKLGVVGVEEGLAEVTELSQEWVAFSLSEASSKTVAEKITKSEAFEVVVQNAAENFTVKVYELALVAELVLAAPTITKPAKQITQDGTEVSLQITATELPEEFKAKELPTGLSISSSGLITGTPSAKSLKTVTLESKNVFGSASTVTFEWRTTRAFRDGWYNTIIGIDGFSYYPFWKESAESESEAEAKAKTWTFAEQFGTRWDRFDTSYQEPAAYKYNAENGLKFITLYKSAMSMPELKGTGTVSGQAEGSQGSLTESEVKNRIKEIAEWMEEVGAAKLLEVMNEPYESAEGEISTTKYAEIWKWAVEVLKSHPTITPVAKYWGYYEGEGPEFGKGFWHNFVEHVKTLTGGSYAEYEPKAVAVHLYNKNGGSFTTLSALNEGGPFVGAHTSTERKEYEKGEGLWAGYPHTLTAGEAVEFENLEGKWKGSGWSSYETTLDDIKRKITNPSLYITETGEKISGEVSEPTSSTHVKSKIKECRENPFIKGVWFFAFTGSEFGFYKGVKPPKEERTELVTAFNNTISEALKFMVTPSMIVKGLLNFKATKKLTSLVRGAGTLTRGELSIVKVFQAAVTMVGSLPVKRSIQLIATVTATGAVKMAFSIKTLVTGQLTAAGVLLKELSFVRKMTGVVTGAGVLTRQFSLAKALTGTVTAAGSLKQAFSISKLLEGVVTGVGRMTQAFSIKKVLQAVVTGAGTVRGSFPFRLITVRGSLTPVGSLGRTFTLLRTFAASVTVRTISRSRLIVQAKVLTGVVRVIKRKRGTVSTPKGG